MRAASTPTQSSDDLDKKVDIEHAESVHPNTTTPGAGSSNVKRDAALEILGDSAKPMHVTAEDDRLVLRKIDLWLMPIICMVYFLQQLDK